ncbi:MAG: DM13 domain-containing protein [Acidimicrobiia bacterium]
MTPNSIGRRRGVLAALIALGLGLGAWLAFGYFGVQALFVDDRVNEALPVFAAESTGPPPVTASTTGADLATPSTTVTVPPPAATTAAIMTTHRGRFVRRSHPASGTAVVLGNGTALRYLRFEDDFATDNGPDLNVYLSTAAPGDDAGRFDDDFVDLGDLRGNVGSQNYEIPAGVDLARYRTVVVWCVRFDVAFGVAELELA